MRLTTRLCAVVLLSLSLLVTSGCTLTLNPEKRATRELRGVWYEDSSGARYEFMAGGDLILPRKRLGGGNTATYSVVPDKRLRVDNAGVVAVDTITRLDDQQLVLTSPSDGTTRTFFRDYAKTTVGKERTIRIDGGLAALKRFPSINPLPKIVWLQKAPKSSESTWTKWPTDSIARYKQAWDWSGIHWDGAPGGWSGTGDETVFSVDFPRPVPGKSGKGMTATMSPGLARIAVAYSASWKTYPAGTYVYTSRGMLYSLGDGYMMGVGIGKTQAEGFFPFTRK